MASNLEPRRTSLFEGRQMMTSSWKTEVGLVFDEMKSLAHSPLLECLKYPYHIALDHAVIHGTERGDHVAAPGMNDRLN